jgi:hypothetical protein
MGAALVVLVLLVPLVLLLLLAAQAFRAAVAVVSTYPAEPYCSKTQDAACESLPPYSGGRAMDWPSAGSFQEDPYVFMLYVAEALADMARGKGAGGMLKDYSPEYMNPPGHPFLGCTFESQGCCWVIFRGTVSGADLHEIDAVPALPTLTDAPHVLASAGFPPALAFPHQRDAVLGGALVGVHTGFYEAYLACQSVVKNLKATKPLFIGGHSMGAALAQICALDLAPLVPAPVLYASASPRVGDPRFAQALRTLVPNSFNIANTEDPIPQSVWAVEPEIGSTVIYATSCNHLLRFSAPTARRLLAHKLGVYRTGVHGFPKNYGLAKDCDKKH